jgi:uncharacterized delta-60 repeat protein
MFFRLPKPLDDCQQGTSGKGSLARFYSLFCLVAFQAGAAWAQSPPPLAFPNLHLTTNGSVYAIAMRPDGGVVVGGRFSEIDGVPRFNIARLNAAGELDQSWAPVADGAVTALAVDADDSVYTAGEFASINGDYRFGLAKISGSGIGELFAEWRSISGGTFRSLVLDGNGSLFVAGSFLAGSSNDGRYLENFVKVSCATGQLDRDWNPEIGSILAVAYDGNGHLFASADLLSLAKISAIGNGEVDSAWRPASDFSQITDIATGEDGSVFVGGHFCPASDATACVSLAKISGSGEVDTNWRPVLPIPDGSGIWVYAMRIDSMGKLLVSGIYGNPWEPFLVKILPDENGLVDATWTPNPDAVAYDLVPNPDGSIFLGGDFSHLGAQPRKGLAKINKSGLAEPTRWDATFPGIVNALTVLADGSTVVGGEFEYVQEEEEWTNLLRLNSDGSLDTNWNPRADGIVRALASDTAGNVYVGGSFMHIGGQTRYALAKFSAAGNGAIDLGWNPSPGIGLDGIGISAIAIGTQGDIFVGGDFFGSIGGQTPRYGLAKLSAVSGLANPDWLPLYARPVNSIAIGPDGSVFVAGHFFFFVNNPSREQIAKISASGRGIVDPVWAPMVDGPVTSMVVDAQSNLFLAGSFTEIDGQDRYRVAKLVGPTGAVDLNWTHALYYEVGGLPLNDPVERVTALALDTDGHLYFGGMFGAIDGHAASFVAKLDTSGVGLIDPDWNPSPQLDLRHGGLSSGGAFSSSFFFPPIRAIATRPDGTVLLGGDYYALGNHLRSGLAVVPPAPLPDAIFLNGFDSQ